ncbi:MAG TPA: non-canonical purine NTP pyrophosphatase, RdgB/HAM1 family [Gammaproteobacteria bacterium]|nr:RdgB/HAM1 family non-canonical purine NTP pyrophosphatase [Arenicellales bacterium]MDP6290476.1 RdgB/HAM1 family non-canonical purine NTP pyrophosphatase [Arenicellales bacterium]HCV21678.1 non-canonical purine NTP pyrophosphatase, RdgB/HAM1 family [Gammaproteobacteria bacterium]HJL56457.1 RdgB/HAM1 family non-canonical purine NTP pyrophosphatase [Arenicellales bacterium]
MKQEIVLASDNAGKLKEINALLHASDFVVVGQASLGVPGADETGGTFIENAILKARNASQYTGRSALADDSGLEVDALDGAPGVHSARFAGSDATDARNVAKLLSALDGVPHEQRGARFRCVMAYLRQADDATPLICQGTWEGSIAEQGRGDNGFGYDPVFWVVQENRTAAELDSGLKNRLSHRGQALRAMVAQLVQMSRQSS